MATTRALATAGKSVPLVPLDPEGEIWGRLRGETTVWYGRFVTFRDLDPDERRISRVWAISKRVRLGLAPDAAVGPVPPNWWAMARLWRWRERATAWDDDIARRDTANTLATKRSERDQRVALLKGLRAKTVLALQALDPQDFKPGELVQAVKVLTEQLRLEYDDEPAKRVQHQGDPDMPLKVVLGLDMDRV